MRKMAEENKEIAGDDILEIIAEINSRYRDPANKEKIKPLPIWENQLIYDSSSETLEPIYFWLLEKMETFFGEAEKVVDNFTASPTSGYFAELGARATRMQEEAMKILGSVNTVVKSIINIIYDLKEYEIRLKQYEIAKSKKKEERETGLLGLKQVWMDNVDIKRGRGSINMMAYDLSFTTLRDAFMVANSVEDVDKMDLNDRVKRVLKPRIAEFIEWHKRSESELRKRFEIEKVYLKSQVSALQLYSRWAKPYLKTAEQLRMKETASPNLVSSFNTILLEVTLLGIKEIDIKELAYYKELPINYANLKLKRKYYACALIDLNFRGIPRRITQEGHYAFGGRTTADFAAFTLNEDELALFHDKLKKSEISEALKLVELTTSESLDQLKEDIDKYIEKRPEQEEEKKEEPEANPFTALFGLARKQENKAGKKKKEEEKRLEEIKKKGIKPDSHEESIIRKVGEMQAAENCFNIYNIYKKTHDMASPQREVDFWELFKSKGKKGF